MKKYIGVLLISSILSACEWGNSNSNAMLNSFTKKIEKTPNDASIYFERAQYFEKQNQDSLAINDYVKAIELDTTKSIYYSAAANLMFTKKDSRCIPFIQKALAINPNDVNSHLKIATIQFYNKKHTEAFTSINTVLRTDVYNYEAYFLKGMCYKEMGDTATAFSSFETAVRMQPENPEPYMQLAAISLKKNPKQAILYYENAFKADTNNVEPLNGIGNIFVCTNEITAAKKAFTRCIMAQPGFAKAYYNMGCMLMDEDSTDKAIRQFDMAIKNDLKFVDAYYNRGVCFEKQNKLKEALENYSQVLEFDVDNELAKQAKKRLINK
jgi:tetratricopeptide (TPR) repeat protein